MLNRDGVGLARTPYTLWFVSTFATPRLLARPVEADDLPVFERLWGDKRVTRTLGGARDRAQVQKSLSEAVDHWSRWGFGRWLLQDGERPVGTVKLARCEIAGVPEVELGYALFSEFWGAGYATEAASGALDFGRGAAGLREVVAFALASNVASFAVMQRLGFRHERDLDLPAGPHELHRLTLVSE